MPLNARIPRTFSHRIGNRRRIARVRFLTVVLLSSLTAIAHGSNPRLRLSVEPAEVNVGDKVDVHLDIDDPDFDPQRIVGVTFQPDLDRWHIVSSWRTREDRWSAELRPFELGELAIPATTVLWRLEDGSTTQTLLTSATLSVHSVRPPTASNTQLYGLREPAELPRNWRRAWIAAACALALALGAWIATRLARGRRAKKIEPAAPELPPGLWALRELDYRSQLPVSMSGPAKTIFSLVSEVIRLYIERRYLIRAIDMTTLECLRALHAALRARQERARPDAQDSAGRPRPDDAPADDDVLRWVRDFLDECDLVKFTKIEIPRERWRTIWHDARMIVQRTTPRAELGLTVDAPDATREEAG
jgi:hypothetical protein